MKNCFVAVIFLFLIAGCQSAVKSPSVALDSSNQKDSRNPVLRSIAGETEIKAVEIEPLLDYVAGEYRIYGVHEVCDIGGTENDPQGRQTYFRCDNTVQLSRVGKKLIVTKSLYGGCVQSFSKDICSGSIEEAKKLGTPFDMDNSDDSALKKNEVLFDGSNLKMAIFTPDSRQYKFGDLLEKTFGKSPKGKSVFIAVSNETDHERNTKTIVQMGRYLTGFKTSDIHGKKAVRNAFINNLILTGDVLFIGTLEPSGNSSSSIYQRLEARKIPTNK